MNKQETAQVLAYMSAAFPHVRVSKETAIVYHDLLQDLTFDQTMATVRDLLATAEFFPPPAAIRRAYAADTGLLAPDPTEAWNEVIGKARTEGRYARQEFSHPAITAVAKSLGWYEVCMSTNPETLRAHFLRLYETERTKHDRQIVTEGIRSLPAALNRRELGLGA